MKLYTCSNCHSLIYFENNICLHCGYPLGFDAASLSLVTLVYEGNNVYSNFQNNPEKFHYCKNAEFGTCNWLIRSSPQAGYCQACELNRIIPDLDMNGKYEQVEEYRSGQAQADLFLISFAAPCYEENGKRRNRHCF